MMSPQSVNLPDFLEKNAGKVCQRSDWMLALPCLLRSQTMVIKTKAPSGETFYVHLKHGATLVQLKGNRTANSTVQSDSD